MNCVVRLAAIALIAFALSQCAWAASGETVLCLSGRGHAKRSFGQFVFTVSRAPKSDKLLDAEGESFGCRFYVKTESGRLVYSNVDWAVETARGDLDVDGDGQPDIIVETYSGGAHCCWTYWIVSGGSRPHLIAELYNERGIGFRYDVRMDAVVLDVLDGKFDYFDHNCHSCTVFPQVFLRYKGGRFIEVGSSYRRFYDRLASRARKKLTAGDIADFRSAPPKKQPQLLQLDYEKQWASILTIVFAYLYSGRESQAWKEFAEMWPAWDQERMKQLIIETRAKGVLRYTARPSKR